MNVEEVLLDKLIKDRPRWHPQAALKFEEVDILGRNVMNVANGEEGVIGVRDVGGHGGLLRLL